MVLPSGSFQSSRVDDKDLQNSKTKEKAVRHTKYKNENKIWEFRTQNVLLTEESQKGP